MRKLVQSTFATEALVISAALLLLPLFSSTVLAQPFGLTSRTVVSGVNIPLDDPSLSGGTETFQAARVFPNLVFSSPVFLTSARDGSDRLFVLEQSGRIRVFPNSNSVSSTTVFLDIVSRVSSGGERGLLGLAFDPNYAANRYFYVYYTAQSDGRTRVSRFRTSAGNANFVSPSTEEIIIERAQPASNHNGGMIAFGPDGYLYIGVGDGGSSNDPWNSGQDCTTMLGAMLRINPRNGTPYSIPADNPYAGGGNFTCGDTANASSRNCGISGEGGGQICREIWASGLRNPWRFSFDRSTGKLWVGDVGQNAREEVGFIERGDNLGWRRWEGFISNINPGNIPISNFKSPVLDYPRNSAGGYSVTGGYVYRGSAYPNLFGKYIYGDYVTSNIWALEANGNTLVSNQLIASVYNLSSFGEDEAGELYATRLSNGYIYRIQASGGGSGTPMPTTLSGTGLFTNTGSLTVKPGVIEYDVAAELWSDNAEKRRWIALPGTQRITFSPTGNFTYPVGTALVKLFALPLANGSTRRLETRIFFKHNQGWRGYTYKWNSGQTDANLLTASDTDVFTVPNPAGGTMSQTWTYPGRNDCFSCHTAASGAVQGVVTRQLNKDFNYGGTVDNQLRSWNNIGLFTSSIGSHTNYEAYPSYHDETKPVESRARAYLAVNCSNCHRPPIPRSGELDMRYDTTNNNMNVIDARPSYGNVGLPDAYRIRTGVVGSSVVWERMRRLDGNRMPQLGSSVVDQTGVDLMARWISSLGGVDVIPPSPPSNLGID